MSPLPSTAPADRVGVAYEDFSAEIWIEAGNAIVAVSRNGTEIDREDFPVVDMGGGANPPSHFIEGYANLRMHSVRRRALRAEVRAKQGAQA